MIDLIDVSKSFGSRRLFEHVNLRIGPGDRIGLVGPNGTGKTTLFRILTGEIAPDSGRVDCKKGLRIGLLPQEVHPSLARDQSMREYCVREARGVGPLLDERASLLHRMDAGTASEADVHRLAEVDDALRARDADSLPKEAESVLRGLGFENGDMDRSLRTLSGGLLMRVELARLLLDGPDLLLLDEPTNHLDLEGLLWFEEYLQKFRGAYVLVAHDREFLNRSVQRIAEVSMRGATDYGGDPHKPVYDRYVEARARAVELAWKHYEEQQARIKEIEDFIASNRVRKDRAQVVQSRIRMLEKLDRLEPPEPLHRVRFRFPQPPRSPDLVLSLEGVSRRYGSRVVFENLDLRLHRGERLALVGVNGAGKSSLLRIVAGVAAPDAGVRKEADRLSIGYFAQDQFEILRPDRTAIQHLYEVADAATAPHVKGVLGAFLFGEDDMDKKVAALSGGEKARLMLGRLLLQPHGLLVLDEPTNHLDIASREVLEAAVKDHQGTILFTTHDRRFMDTVATAILELRDGRLTRYEGNYSYYVTRRSPPSLTAPEAVSRPAVRVTATPRDLEKAQKREEAERRNRIYRLLKPLRDRVGDLEARIDAAETELRAIEARIASPDLYKDPDQARAVTLAAREARKRVDLLYEAWQKAAGELEAEEARFWEG